MFDLNRDFNSLSRSNAFDPASAAFSSRSESPFNILPKSASLQSSNPTEMIGDTAIYRGTAGKDFLTGSTGKNRLEGIAGRDFLTGNQGNDILVDPDGGDLLIGGTGADQFQITSKNQTQGMTRISDFEVGLDTIQITDPGTSYNALTFKEVTLRDLIDPSASIQVTDLNTGITTNNAPVGVQIFDGGKAIAQLTGVKATELTPKSFSFVI